MIAGICGGLEDYTGVDVTIWRIVFAVIALPGGLSIFIYFVLWVLIPLEPKGNPTYRDQGPNIDA